jgi:hypothetical protein
MDTFGPMRRRNALQSRQLAVVCCSSAVFTLVNNIFAIARTKLHCQSGCKVPTSISGHQFIKNNSLVGKMSPTVTWHGCESIYFICPTGSIVATVNTFLNIFQVHDQNAATIYCGRHQNYYILYENQQISNKFCSNSFDYIDCIGKILSI